MNSICTYMLFRIKYTSVQSADGAVTHSDNYFFLVHKDKSTLLLVIFVATTRFFLSALNRAHFYKRFILS